MVVTETARQRRRYMWVPLLAVWVAAVLLAFLFDDTGAAVGGLIGAGLGAVFAARFYLPARARRYAEHEQVECGLRVVVGEQPGLAPRWRHGVGTLAPGLLTFRSTLGGMRFLRRTSITVEVLQIDGSRPRMTWWREALHVSPGTEVVELVTPSARLEWAVPSHRMGWARERLEPSQHGNAVG
jgi:hypothetical protein